MNNEILTEFEKNYLIYVAHIDYFHRKNLFVKKFLNINKSNECIGVFYNDKLFEIIVDNLDINTLYKGMELNKPYTLEDLSIDLW